MEEDHKAFKSFVRGYATQAFKGFVAMVLVCYANTVLVLSIIQHVIYNLSFKDSSLVIARWIVCVKLAVRGCAVS